MHHSHILAYLIAQVAGAIIAAGALYLIASGKVDYDLAVKGLAANGFGAASPGGYSLASGIAIEIILTFGFLMIILGSTDTRAPAGFAPIAIGLGLTLIHLISIPITNTSVNPARSTGPALIQGGMALQQLWMFWVAPLIGGVLGGVAYRWLAPEEAAVKPAITGEPTQCTDSTIQKDGDGREKSRPFAVYSYRSPTVGSVGRRVNVRPNWAARQAAEPARNNETSRDTMGSLPRPHIPSVPMMMRHSPPRKFRLEGVGELSRGHAQ